MKANNSASKKPHRFLKPVRFSSKTFSMLYFNRNYFSTFVIVLLIEFAIAYFHFSYFIRGFLGDVLVIVLLYCFLKIFIRKNVFKIAISVLTFAFFVEILQYFKLAEIQKVQSKVLLTIIGSVFDVWDLVAYFIGFLLILLIENLITKECKK